MRCLFKPLFLLACTVMTPTLSADEPLTPNWAIAIHGGAGSDPGKWDAAKTQGRLDGLKAALTAGRDLLAAGGTAMDAVETVIRKLEDDAFFNAGRGAVVTTEGNAELDASFMDGSSLGCGAVAGVTNTKNPISLARLVMSETKHILLIGDGANQFAVQRQVPLVQPDYFLSQRGDHNRDAVPARPPGNDEAHFGTVGCVALDQHGDLAAGTSTGGTPKKLAGRVGDSPIIGAGNYAANDTCAVSGTGWGEEYIRHSVAYDIAAQMRYAQRSLDEAVTEIMRERLKPGTGGVIAVSHDGRIVMQHNTPGMSCGAANSHGRFETQLALPNGGLEAEESAETQIRAMLAEQLTAWNSGDIDEFMKAYWRSEQLTFTSGGTITRGWQATLERYRKRYPDPQAMGRVEFSELELHRLADAVFQVHGVWSLQRNSDALGGRFTLVIRRFPEGWRIVHDHTSRRDE